MKAKDETGNTYGILTVLERAGSNKHGKALWKCQCECGKEIIVDGTSLRTGNTTSCGCRRLSAEKTEIGKQYGELTVISVAGRTNAKRSYGIANVAVAKWLPFLLVIYILDL